MDLQIGGKWGKYTIMGVATIKHGKFFRNTDITHQVALKGTRGAEATAFVYRSGNFSKLVRNFGYFEGEMVIDGTK